MEQSSESRDKEGEVDFGGGSVTFLVGQHARAQMGADR
jgi:hypothetical protein